MKREMPMVTTATKSHRILHALPEDLLGFLSAFTL
jgi:hypothetical protein